MSKPSSVSARKTIASAALALFSVSAIAADVPVNQTEQAPGFFRSSVGDYTVTALYDGYVNLEPSLLKGLSEDDIQSLLARMFQKSDKGMQTAVNGFLIHTGENLVLVDAGAAKCFGPTVGNIIPNIQAAGYQPEDVDTVLVTHMHADHICGLVSPDGNSAFPNATVWASSDDADFWLSKDTADAAPADAKPFFEMAQNSIAPYQASQNFKTFTTGDTIVPGFSVVPTPGHTPGHTAYLLQSGDESLLIWGDIVHSHAVQLAHPEVSIEFDVDSAQAIESREAILEKSAENRWMIAGAHLPFPGLGHLRKESKGYSWIPVAFAPLQPSK